MLEPAPLMSTLAPMLARMLAQVAAPATLPASGTAGVPTAAALSLVLLVLLVVTIGITAAAYFLGGFRRGVRDGPARLPVDRPVWPTAAALGAGAFAYLLLVGAGVAAARLAAPPAAVEAAAPSAGQMLVVMKLSAAAYVGAILVALGLHALARRSGRAGPLGLAPRRLPRGVLFGLLALPVVLPWTFTAGVALQLVRVLLGLPTDTMHAVLKAMRDDPTSGMLVWGVLTSVVVAPLAEEILFRGLLQTSLVYGLPRLFGAGGQPAELAAPAEPEGTAFAPPSAVLEYESPPPAADPAPKWRWLGIILSAAVFTSLHEPWSWPIIFLLGLSFGYVYERTGNLWASMTIHFGFNAMNVAFLLLTL